MMKKPILKKSSEAVVRGEGSDYEIHNYITNGNSEKLSVAVSMLNGKLWKTMNTVSDRVYYIIEGGGDFIFEKEKLRAVKGDMVLVPAGLSYRLEGKFKAVLINAPPFNIKNEVQLSEK